MAQRRVILGKGGHAKAFAHAIFEWNVIFGDFRPNYIENDDEVLPDDKVYIGVGDIPTRKKLYEKFRDQIPNRGIQYMKGVHVGPDVKLGDNVLLNTGCQVDHDCKIGDHCVISPGAILCGEVTLGECCFVGAGAIIINGVKLEAGTFVPAGTLVCGPDDFRVPQRMVRTREVPLDPGEAKMELSEAPIG